MRDDESASALSRNEVKTQRVKRKKLSSQTEESTHESGEHTDTYQLFELQLVCCPSEIRSGLDVEMFSSQQEMPFVAFDWT